MYRPLNGLAFARMLLNRKIPVTSVHKLNLDAQSASLAVSSNGFQRTQQDLYTMTYGGIGSEEIASLEESSAEATQSNDWTSTNFVLMSR